MRLSPQPGGIKGKTRAFLLPDLLTKEAQRQRGPQLCFFCSGTHVVQVDSTLNTGIRSQGHKCQSQWDLSGIRPVMNSKLKD